MPQIVIQIWYMITISLDKVAMLSAAFSVISIAVTILTVMTQKRFLRKQSIVSIGFHIKERSLKNGNIRKIRGIKKEIISLFGAQKRSIDVERRQFLSADRIHLEFHVDINENENVDFQQKMQKAIDTGKIAVIFQKEWKLKGVPVISNLTCIRKSEIIEETVETSLAAFQSQNKVTGVVIDENGEIATSVQKT